MKHSTTLWLMLSLAAATGCADDESGEAVDLDRCTLSSDCDDLRVCRDGLCVDAPICEDAADCTVGESCVERRCAFDDSACTTDSSCPDEGEICDEGECRVGCRAPADCEETEICSDDFACLRRPCTELPCDEGYDCIAESGTCQLRPCNGGCEEPLACREEDDTCVACFDDDGCDTAQFCAADGFCANEACDVHSDCPAETYCIDEQCQRPPECDDDGVEENDFWPEGTIIAEGEHAGFVSCPFDDDFHPFVASGNRSLRVEVLFDHELGNVDLEVLNTVGVTFGRADSETDDETLTLNLFSTGVYSIRIYQPDGGTQGVPYTLRVSTDQPVAVTPDECLTDGFEPNETPEQAARLYTGRWTGPSICAGDQDYYLLPALAGELYRVCVTPSELVDVPLGLEVLDSDGAQILSEAGLAKFCVEEDLLETDDYVTHVFALEPGDESPYHIEFYVDPGCRLFDDEYDQAGLNNRLPREGEPPLLMLEAGTEHELRVCPDNPDYWPVPLLRRDLLTASIDFVHADGDLQMRLLRPSGTTILSSTGTGDNETIDRQAAQDGTHYLRIYGEGDDGGAYIYEYSVTPWCQADSFEENDSADAAAPATLGTTSSLWRCAGDDDWFSTTIAAETSPAALEVSIAYEAGDGTLELEVTPPGGEPVGATAEPGARTVRLDSGLVTEQPYLIRVFGDELAQNAYTLTVTVEPE